MSNSLAPISKEIAYILGERHGRTVSGVVGDGLATSFGGRGDGWTRLFDLMLVAGAAATVMGAVRPTKAVVVGGLAILLLYGLGQAVYASRR